MLKKMIFDNMHEEIVTVNDQGEVIKANTAAEIML